jgi:hypothetical protein
VSRAFSVFLASRPDLRSVLEGLRWSRLSAEEASSEGVEQFHRESREWFADAWGPSPMSWEDAPPGATALQAGIAWHVAVSLEGSEAGLREVMRAVNAIARSGAGVIADEGDVWKPGQRRRDARWSSAVERPSAETELLRMIWWTIGVNPFSDKGAQSLVAILQRVLPEAIPVRWGQLEPYSHNLEAEGMRGLADFIANRSDGRFMGKVRPPFYDFTLWKARWPYEPRQIRVPRPADQPPWSLNIEVGGSLLGEAGWEHQLAVAFREISLVIRPFYADARIEHGVTVSSDGQQGRTEVPPLHPIRWSGFPRVAPLAMVVGPPYITHWRDNGGTPLDDMLLYSSDSWTDPALNPVPVAPNELLQEFDIRRASDDPRGVGGARVREPMPRSLPPTWPFPLDQR